MHPELIRAEIKMRGKTLTDVARLYDVSPKVVSLALYKPSLSGEKVIAAFLDRPLHELRPLQKSPSPDNRNPNTGFRLFASPITPDSTQILP